MVVGHETFLLIGPLHRLLVPKEEEVLHPDVRILVDDVGFGVMLEMTVVPPVGGGPLRSRVQPGAQQISQARFFQFFFYFIFFMSFCSWLIKNITGQLMADIVDICSHTKSK